MIEVQIRPTVLVPGIEETVTHAVQAAMRQAGREPEGLEVTVVLTGDEEVADLNQKFRGVEGPTDVLSFEVGGEDVTGELATYLGDVVISVDRARAQAEEAGHSVQAEIALLVAHGVLHLLGYDHVEEAEEREMWALQEAAMREALRAGA